MSAALFRKCFLGARGTADADQRPGPHARDILPSEDPKLMLCFSPQRGEKKTKKKKSPPNIRFESLDTESGSLTRKTLQCCISQKTKKKKKRRI